MKTETTRNFSSLRRNPSGGSLRISAVCSSSRLGAFKTSSELAVWTKLLESGPPQAKASIVQTLKHWQEDAELAGIRGAKAESALPEPERTAWRTLWASVQSLQEKARTGSQPAKYSTPSETGLA
jgi:hypothetical protein